MSRALSYIRSLFPKARMPRLRSIVGLALASALPGLSVPAQAQTTEAPFACDGTFLLAQGANTTLYSIDLTTNPVTYPTEGVASLSYNAAGYNPVDNFIYAISADDWKPPKLYPNAMLVRVSSDGSAKVIDLGPTENDRDQGIPGMGTRNDESYIAAAFSDTTNPADPYYNRFFVLQSGDTKTLHVVDLTDVVQAVDHPDSSITSNTPITLSSTIDVQDIAWLNGKLYGVVTRGARLPTLFRLRLLLEGSKGSQGK